MLDKHGAGNRNRTYDLRITNAPLSGIAENLNKGQKPMQQSMNKLLKTRDAKKKSASKELKCTGTRVPNELGIVNKYT